MSLFVPLVPDGNNNSSLEENFEGQGSDIEGLTAKLEEKVSKVIQISPVVMGSHVTVYGLDADGTLWMVSPLFVCRPENDVEYKWTRVVADDAKRIVWPDPTASSK